VAGSAVKKSMDFKPNVLLGLRHLHSTKMNLEDYESWLRIVPINLFNSSTIKGSSFFFYKWVIQLIRALIGQNQNPNLMHHKIFKTSKQDSQQIATNIMAVSTYTRSLLKSYENFADQNSLRVLKVTVRISIFGIKQEKWIYFFRPAEP
jgi:hypothetical protein